MGQSQSAGQLHQSLGGGHALRAARRSSRDRRWRTSRARNWPRFVVGSRSGRAPSSSRERSAARGWIWLDSHDHAKGSMAWFVVDPSDGRIPALTAEARARQAARAEARKKERTRPGRLLYRSQPLRSLHLARRARLDDAGDLRQLLSDRPGPGLRRDSLRDDSRSASHSDRRRQHAPAADDPQLHGRCAWPLGRSDTLVVETTNIRDEIAYRGSNGAHAETHRAVHAPSRRTRCGGRSR